MKKPITITSPAIVSSRHRMCETENTQCFSLKQTKSHLFIGAIAIGIIGIMQSKETSAV